MQTGVLADHQIRDMIKAGSIAADLPIVPDQIQPASLDLRLGTTAYRVRASFLTGPQRTVTDRLSDFKMHEIDLTQGAVLEKGCVYVVPVMERLSLPATMSAAAIDRNARPHCPRLIPRRIEFTIRRFDPCPYRQKRYLRPQSGYSAAW